MSAGHQLTWEPDTATPNLSASGIVARALGVYPGGTRGLQATGPIQKVARLERKPNGCLNAMRHVILHHHIFKNAGSTLDYSLRRQFGCDFASLDDERHGVVNGAMLLDRLEGDTAIRAISSHHLGAKRYGTALRHGRYRFFHFALVRRPMARFLSIYKFYRRAEFDNIFAKSAKELDIEVSCRY